MIRSDAAPTADEVIDFLDGLRAAHAPILPVFGDRKVLTFMATAASPHEAPALAVRRVVRISEGSEGALHVTLEGPLPRAVAPGERVALSVTDCSRFFGFQLKTPILVDLDRTGRVYEEHGGQTELIANHVYTVHPTEYVTRFFEEVPVADVIALANQLRFALVSVGTHVNVSPRFTFHHETDGQTISLFHGDSVLNKTHLNLQVNDREARLVCDLDQLRGVLLEGSVSTFTAEEHPVAAAAVQAAFTAGQLGVPKRMYRLRAERWAWTAAAGR